MLICPYCQQDYIYHAIIIETNELLKFCPECDTIWEEKEKISDTTGTGLERFMHRKNWTSIKNKFKILDKIE